VIVRSRTVRSEEWQIWRDLRLQALADSPEAFGETLEHAAARLDSEWIDLAANAATSALKPVLAEERARPIAIALVELCSDHANLYAMWVQPTARRLGVGRSLVRASIAIAESEGVPQIRLRVTASNLAAVDLYRGSGFVDTGAREPLRAGVRVETLVMVNDLRGRHAVG
jgi:ribosomal protein S18 acetylase RimI-like enzyme